MHSYQGEVSLFLRLHFPRTMSTTVNRGCIAQKNNTMELTKQAAKFAHPYDQLPNLSRVTQFPPDYTMKFDKVEQLSRTLEKLKNKSKKEKEKLLSDSKITILKNTSSECSKHITSE